MLQVFVIHQIVGTHEFERGLVVKVLPLALNFLMRLGEQGDRLAPPLAAFLASGYPALRGFQRALGFAIPAGGEDACPIRKSRKGLNAQIDASFLPR